MIDPLRPKARQEVSFSPGDVVFLCEGMDDCAVIAELTRAWRRPPKIGTRAEVRGFNWKDEFVSLKKQAIAREIRAIGFVFDVESSREKRLHELTEWYRGARLVMPARDSQKAVTALTDTLFVEIAYLLNPPDAPCGSIEDLFVPQVSSSPIGPCIEQLLQCYAERQPSRESEAKLRVRTFLAHKNAYHTGLNLGIRDKHLNCEGPQFAPLIEFLELFNH